MSDQIHVRHIAFIYHRFDMGGIETLILRAADTYVNQGLRVTLFTRPGAMLSQLHPRVEVVLFDKYIELYRSSRLLDANTTVIAFDPVSFMVMRRMQLSSWWLTGKKCMGHVGVFHPRAWSWPGDNRFFGWLVKRIFNLTPDEFLFYMSKSVMDETSRRLKLRREIRSQIIHLPVSESRSDPWAPHGGRELRIVSVGRLVPAKCYNRAIPKIVKRLASRAVGVQWDIWGDGDDYALIKAEIQRQGVENRVRLMGALEYSRFEETVRKYDAFVGVGTAILEAAMLGMPAICAIDFDSEKSYGFLDAAPNDSIGEMVASARYTTIERCVSDYWRMSLEERIEVGSRCRAAAIAKSNSDEGYLKMKTAPRWPGLAPNELLSLVLGIPYLAFLDSRKLRRLGQFLRTRFQEEVRND